MIPKILHSKFSQMWPDRLCTFCSTTHFIAGASSTCGAFSSTAPSNLRDLCLRPVSSQCEPVDTLSSQAACTYAPAGRPDVVRCRRRALLKRWLEICNLTRGGSRVRIGTRLSCALKARIRSCFAAYKLVCYPYRKKRDPAGKAPRESNGILTHRR